MTEEEELQDFKDELNAVLDVCVVEGGGQTMASISPDEASDALVSDHAKIEVWEEASYYAAIERRIKQLERKILLLSL